MLLSNCQALLILWSTFSHTISWEIVTAVIFMSEHLLTVSTCEHSLTSLEYLVLNISKHRIKSSKQLVYPHYDYITPEKKISRTPFFCFRNTIHFNLMARRNYFCFCFTTECVVKQHRSTHALTCIIWRTKYCSLPGNENNDILLVESI